MLGSRSLGAVAVAVALALVPVASARAAAGPALQQLAPPPPSASGASGAIDPAAATRAYLDLLPAAARAQSDAYFEGGYWLSLVGFLWTAAILVLLLHSGASAWMRDRAERLSRFHAVQAFLVWLQFLAATALLSFPLDVYRDFVREHRYGLSNLGFAAWLGELGKGFLVAAVFGGLAMAVLYAIVRRLSRTWWLWGAAASVALLAVGATIAPVLIAPLFNHPKRLADPRVVAPILSLARANGIEANEVWEIDASKQTKRISANVSGFLGTERITLNDNLLARASLPEIESVMGHEMGHYVLHHVEKGLLELGVIIVAGFALAQALFERLRARWQERWKVRGPADPAGLPLMGLLLSTYLFVLTPVLNTVVRTQEQEADLFGLNAAAQPDGFAQIALKLSEYRKLEPGPLEETIFYDHPSGRTRILAAMRWKAEHPETWAAPAVPSRAPAAAIPARAPR
jgi:STE24 endopeptidase